MPEGVFTTLIPAEGISSKPLAAMPNATRDQGFQGAVLVIHFGILYYEI